MKRESLPQNEHPLNQRAYQELLKLDPTQEPDPQGLYVIQLAVEANGRLPKGARQALEDVFGMSPEPVMNALLYEEEGLENDLTYLDDLQGKDLALALAEEILR